MLLLLIRIATISMIDKPPTYAALVKSLEYSVTDYEHNKYDRDWDNWPLRDVVEQGCLLVLCQLTGKCGVDGLLNSRFVERWVAKESWGDNEYDRAHNFVESMRQLNRLNELLIPIFRDTRGQLQLQKAKLLTQDVVSLLNEGNKVKVVNTETGAENFDGM